MPGILLALVGAAAIWSIESPRTMLYFSGKTEYLTVEVVDPQRAAIQLPAVFDIDAKACRKSLLLTPAVGSVVQYVRPRGGDLLVLAVVKPGTVVNADQLDYTFTSQALLQLKVRRDDESCSFDGRVRLPANGHLTIGQINSVVSGPAERPPELLLSGRLQVFGRAVSSLFGIPLTYSPFVAGALYPVQDFQLPGGTVLANALATERPEGEPPERTPWTGYVELNDVEKFQALEVEATSNARSVQVFLPSPPTHRGIGGSESDVVSLTLGARLLGDPNLRWLFGVVTVFVLFWPTLRSVGSVGKISTVRRFLFLRRKK